MPDLWMDVDAALAEVPVNLLPLIDDTDFKTRETSVAYNAAGMDLVWNFVTPAGAFTQTAVTPTTSGDYDWAHQGDGMYSIEMPASGGASINNDTEGFGWFSGVATGVLPWRGPTIGFRAAGLNDALIESAYSTTRGLAGTALPNAAAEAAGGLYTRGSGAGQINQDANGRVDSRWVSGNVTVGTNSDKTGYALSSAGIQAIWDALTSALTTVGSIGKLLVDNINATISSRATPAQVNTEADTALADAGVTTTRTGYLDNLSAGAVAQASALATLAGKFTGITLLAEWLGLIAGKQTGNSTARTELRATGAGSGTYDETTDSQEALRDRGDAAWTPPTAAAIADQVWDEAIAGHLGAGSTGAALNAAGSAGDPWTTPLPGAYGAGTAGKIIGDNLNATVGSRATQTSVDDLPTNAELATALAAADDAVLAAIAALNNLSQANIRTAIGLASANLDTQLDALPTNAELATALAAADDAVLAAIAALNNLSQANIRTAIGLGSANLDTQLDALPTNAELATALASADDAVLAAIAALNNLSAAQVTAAVPTAVQNADALLKRDFNAVSGEATRSALNALRFLRNKWTINGLGALSVKKEDDSTEAWAGTVTRSAGDPVSELDPS